MEIPEGIDLSWPVIIFLGSMCVGVFLVAWKVFSMRNADHVKIADDLSKAKKSVVDQAASDKAEILQKIDDTKKALEEKSDTKFESMVNAIGRVEKNAKEDSSVLHGRVNKNAEEIGEVEAKVEYQRGVTDTMKDFMLKDKGV